MPKNILVDLNVILDVLLAREGYEASRDVLRLGETGQCRLHIGAHMVTTFAYVLEAAKVPRPQIRRHVDWLLETFTVVPVAEALLRTALSSNVSDYEDAVVEQTALKCRAATIVTRNSKDFKNAATRAVTPEQYLR